MTPDDLFALNRAHRDSILQGKMPPFKTLRLNIWLLVSVALVLVIGWLAHDSLDASRLDDALETRGQQAQAHVTSLDTATSDGSTAYHIVYSYTPHDAPQDLYTRHTTLPEAAWRLTCRDCEIAIHYLPDRPEISRLAGESLLWTGLGLNIGLGLSAALGFGWSAHACRKLRRVQRIRRDGTLRMGTIHKIHITSQESDVGERVVRILLFLLDGDDATLSHQLNNRRLPGPLRVGQRVAVAYLTPAELELL